MQFEISIGNIISAINARESLTSDQCQALDGTEYPINIVEMSNDGFLGVYNPDPNQLQTLLTDNAKGDYSGNITVDYSSVSGRRRLLATSGLAGSLLTGIKNPTTCLTYGSYMLFSISQTYYPVYDR